MSLKDWRERTTKKAQAEGQNKRSEKFWERFAIIVSALGLFVSATATVGTWWQASLMKDQLTAGDRNNALQTMLESFDNVCAKISSIDIQTETKVAMNAPVSEVGKTIFKNLAEKPLVDSFKMTEEQGAALQGMMALMFHLTTLPRIGPYYVAEEVRALRLSDEFKKEYAISYQELKSAIRIAGLWVSQAQAKDFEMMEGSIVEFLDPREVILKSEQFATATDVDELRMLFDPLKVAKQTCEPVGELLGLWIRGTSFEDAAAAMGTYPTLSVLTEDEAERQYQELISSFPKAEPKQEDNSDDR